MEGNDGILEEYISQESIKLLNDFASHANKSSAAAHPSDEEMWFSFIISIFEHNSNLPPDPLQEWLEAEGWTEEKAFELSRLFEYGISLLDQYKKS